MADTMVPDTAEDNTNKIVMEQKGDGAKEGDTMVPDTAEDNTNKIVMEHEGDGAKEGDTDYVRPGSKENRPFRFEAAWLLHPDFKHLFSSAWTKGDGNLSLAVEHVNSEAVLSRHVVDFFQSLFRRKSRERLEAVYDTHSLELTEEERLQVSSEIVLEEVCAVTFSMKGLKAPGVDGNRFCIKEIGMLCVIRFLSLCVWLGKIEEWIRKS
ncbi:hypothetical protein COLO4_36360 [Corchorus olitorius]|uniref:Uncharacterized protein n=1 Tax=Corchorus olitorius TaxID=93759 RepID=A0A1R3G9G0_9ROSI|nr:hypothetical protein COLO4_36360 [Corchorus olitorius]